jgi:protein TonB
VDRALFSCAEAYFSDESDAPEPPVSGIDPQAVLALPPASAPGARIRVHPCACLALLLHLLVGGMVLAHVVHHASGMPITGVEEGSRQTGLVLLGRVSLGSEGVFSSGSSAAKEALREGSGMDAHAQQPQAAPGQEPPPPVAEKIPVPASATLAGRQKEKREPPRERRVGGGPAISPKPAPGAVAADARALAGAVAEDSEQGRGKSSVAPPGSGMGAEAATGNAGIAPFGGANGPSFKHFVKPEYPALARRQGITGEVVLRVLIDADGKAARVEVHESAHESLARSAREAILRSTFHPLRRNGLPVSCWSLLPVVFTLERG